MESRRKQHVRGLVALGASLSLVCCELRVSPDLKPICSRFRLARRLLQLTEAASAPGQIGVQDGEQRRHRDGVPLDQS